MNVMTPVAAATETESEKLGRFALDLQLADVPADVLTLAREHFLDALGIALASSKFDFGESILKGAQALGEGSQATAIGSGAKLPAPSAALVNGVLAHGLDFDDTHIGAVYHATSPALAAALAAGEANKSTGAEVLAAFTAALEIGCRLATVGAGAFHDRAFHPTSLCGTFAAAAVAGRLAKVDHETMTWALGLCGSQASGILERGTSWLKRLHPGWAAHCGLSAMALARAGFTGPNTVFEGHRGFYASHIQHVPTGADLPSHDLGRTWQTLGIALKPYPCCHFIHGFVDAALALRDRVDLDQVERIDCPLTPGLHKMVAEPRARCIRPANAYQAMFSVQYVTAAALVRGRVDLATFFDEPLDAPDVLAVAAKTHCVADPASDYPVHFPGEVVIHFKDGRMLGVRKPTSLGTPETPLPRAAIEEKFLKNATRAIARATADKIIAAVYDIEKARSLSTLMSLCTIERQEMTLP